MVELVGAIHVAILLDRQELVVEQVVEVLQAEQGITTTFLCYDVQDVFIYLVHLVGKLPLVGQDGFPRITHLIILYGIVVVCNFCHFFHFSGERAAVPLSVGNYQVSNLL